MPLWLGILILSVVAFLIAWGISHLAGSAIDFLFGDSRWLD